MFIIIDHLGMSKNNALKIGVLAIILGAAAYLALRQRQPHPLAIGEGAPDFTVPAFPSGSLGLGQYHQQVVVLNFWATWCEPCVEETPSLVKFAESVRPAGVAVVGVSEDQDLAALEKFIQQFHITYAIGRDPERTLAARFGTYQFPETYILDRHGRIAEKLIGPADFDDPRLLSFVRELAHGSGSPEK
jgi:peroxiredoxin